jgi:hypothetical protein
MADRKESSVTLPQALVVSLIARARSWSIYE